VPSSTEWIGRQDGGAACAARGRSPVALGDEDRGQAVHLAVNAAPGPDGLAGSMIFDVVTTHLRQAQAGGRGRASTHGRQPTHRSHWTGGAAWVVLAAVAIIELKMKALGTGDEECDVRTAPGRHGVRMTSPRARSVRLRVPDDDGRVSLQVLATPLCRPRNQRAGTGGGADARPRMSGAMAVSERAGGRSASSTSFAIQPCSSSTVGAPGVDGPDERRATGEDHARPRGECGIGSVTTIGSNPWQPVSRPVSGRH
jgi:hypothetical protein